MPTPSIRVGSSLSWSAQIADRYRCTLPSDLVGWFDDELWRESSTGDETPFFDAPIDPMALLAPAPEHIWPALMPNDFLPLVGNRIGDWLCLRFGADSQVRDIVYWYHGGGDWIPWGRSLSEALLFDALRSRLPGSGRDHAIPAPIPNAHRRRTEVPPSEPTTLQRWATDQLHERLPTDLWKRDRSEVLELLVDSDVSNVAVSCQLTIAALGLPKDTQIAALWRPVFDPASTGEDSELDPPDEQPDWKKASALANSAKTNSPEVAWAWDIVGYANERDGNLGEAVKAYERGLDCSSFSDQSVRLGTHTLMDDGQKFSAARLIAHGIEPHSESQRAYLNCLRIRSASERRRRVGAYFTELAGRVDHEESYPLLHRAGWDLGAEPLPVYGDLLHQLVHAANASGREALAALSEAHLECFRTRYGR